MSRPIASCPECGCVLSKGRSLPDHRRLFGLLRAAFSNWREDHPFQPTDEDHLRAWALVEAKWCDVDFIAYPTECEENPAVKALFRLAVEATFEALTRKRGYAFLRVSAGGAEILTPRSIAFSEIDQKAFGPLRDAVSEVLEVALGVGVDQLLKAEAA